MSPELQFFLSLEIYLIDYGDGYQWVLPAILERSTFTLLWVYFRWMKKVRAMHEEDHFSSEIPMSIPIPLRSKLYSQA